MKHPQAHFQILPWIIPGILLAAWFAVSRTGWVPDYLLPDPVRIARAGYVYLFFQVDSAPYAGRFIPFSLEGGV